MFQNVQSKASIDISVFQFFILVVLRYSLRDVRDIVLCPSGSLNPQTTHQYRINATFQDDQSYIYRAVVPIPQSWTRVFEFSQQEVLRIVFSGDDGHSRHHLSKSMSKQQAKSLIKKNPIDIGLLTSIAPLASAPGGTIIPAFVVGHVCGGFSFLSHTPTIFRSQTIRDYRRKCNKAWALNSKLSLPG